MYIYDGEKPELERATCCSLRAAQNMFVLLEGGSRLYIVYLASLSIYMYMSATYTSMTKNNIYIYIYTV